MMLRGILVMMLATSLLAEDPLPESVMERPISSREGEPSSAASLEEGNQQEQPLVKANVARAKRSLQFDGWYPMDVSNPMSDDPTIGYQPPPLERVHFSDDPVAKKPMFPVKPKNPTVFVVRAEPKEPEYHSVYGTENVEYFHINPQTNTIRAFRAPSESVGAIQFVSPPQFGVPGENPQNSAFQESSSTKQGLKRDFIYSDIPNKESGISDKADFWDNSDYDHDMVGSFSEYSSVVARPHRWRNGQQANPQGFRYVQSSSNRRRQDFVDLPPSRESGNRRSSRPALHELLGNLKYESQIEETPYLGSATDSARASIFREVPPPEFFQTRPLRRNNIPKSGPRGPTYRQTGLDADETSSRPWYLINTKSERRREPSIASYIYPETRLGEERIHYKPLGPVSYVTKDSEIENEQDSLYNPHLDDHMNSYKPSTSITANSLSELLQIFRFTQVTDKPGKGVTEDPIAFVREFRYTRPTEETPTTHPSFDDNFPTNFRYTSTPSSVEETTTTTETATEVSKNIQFDAVADTNSLDGYLFSDSEASPEYAHPEVKPNIIIINGKGLETSKGLIKDEVGLKAVTSSSPSPVEVQARITTPKKLQPTFENLEIIYPGPTPRTSTSTSSTWPLYVIHEGHSKVRVFGINSAGENPSLSKNTNVLSVNESSTVTTSPYTSQSISSMTSTPDTLSTTRFLVDKNSTSESTHSDITNSSTTTVSSTAKLVDYELVTTGNNDDYEYYYYEESNTPSDMSFGEEYFNERSDQSSSGHGNPHLLPTYRLLPGDLALSPEEGSFSQLFQTRLPRAENFSPPKSDQIPLIPAVGLTRNQFSVARPVFFTKRLRSSEEVSQPFEYLSHLRQLNREKRSSGFTNEEMKQSLEPMQQHKANTQA